MADINEGDNFRKLGRLEPHPEYKGIFVYTGSNLHERSFEEILREISPIKNYRNI